MRRMLGVCMRSFVIILFVTASMLLTGCEVAQLPVVTVESVKEPEGAYAEYNVSDEAAYIGELLNKVKPSGFVTSYDTAIVTSKQVYGNLVLNLFEVKPHMLATYGIYTSIDDTSKDTIALFKTNIGYEETVLVGLTNRFVRLAEKSSGVVGSDEYTDFFNTKLRMEQVGDYFVLIICDEPDVVYDNIVKGLSEYRGEIDSITPGSTNIQSSETSN